MKTCCIGECEIYFKSFAHSERQHPQSSPKENRELRSFFLREKRSTYATMYTRDNCIYQTNNEYTCPISKFPYLTYIHQSWTFNKARSTI